MADLLDLSDPESVKMLEALEKETEHKDKKKKSKDDGTRR